MEKNGNYKHISKFMSLVLRHKPELVGITLDANGWTDLATLISRLNEHGTTVDLDTMMHIIETNPKKRFALNDTRDKIRASQGHSVNVDLGYTPQIPPGILYHGTGQKAVESILATGLHKSGRQHVHLSLDIATAVQVGQRQGKPAIFKVMASAMHAQGHLFYLSENGVWLADHVPVSFLERLDY